MNTYIVCAMTLLMPSGATNAKNEHEKNYENAKPGSEINVSWNMEIPYWTPKQQEQYVDELYLNIKAQKMCNMYIDNMLTAQKKLKPLLGKHGYSAAVRQELPGAPIGQHCLWGQHTQLKRALKQMGDTITIIPNGARTACAQFKTNMREKYKSAEYKNCIREGILYESRQQYQAALEKYLGRNKVYAITPDSIKQTVAAQFAKTHHCADDLTPGTILIVPRYRGSKNKFHAIMYLGRGYVVKDRFIQNENGKHIYAGHNRENIGDLFKTYDMSNVFAADTKKIAVAEYGKELKKIQKMPTDELVNFINNATPKAPALQSQPKDILVQMARAKYLQINNIDNLAIRALVDKANQNTL